MSSILSLPPELLEHITNYISPPTPPTNNLTKHPYAYWPPYLTHTLEVARKSQDSIFALSQTCTHLHKTLSTKAHTQIHISKHTSCLSLWDSIDASPPLGSSIQTAYIQCSDTLTLASVQFVFFLPKITTIFLSQWRDWEPILIAPEDEEEDKACLGTSPAKKLYLSGCGAHEGALAQLFSWFKALNELWYEVAQVEWEGHYGNGIEAPGFTCSAVQRAMAPLRTSLEVFTFTREDPGHEGLWYSDAIDLYEFKRLREFRTQHVLLVGCQESDVHVWEHFNEGLEILEVWYEDTELQKFMLDDAARPEWLFGVLKWVRGEDGEKVEREKLGRVRIISLEWFEGYEDDHNYGEEEWEEEDEELGGMGPGVRMSKELIAAFEEAEVSYSVYLHDQRKWKEVVDGGMEWDEEWEWDDFEIKYPHGLNDDM